MIFRDLDCREICKGALNMGEIGENFAYWCIPIFVVLNCLYDFLLNEH